MKEKSTKYQASPNVTAVEMTPSNAIRNQRITLFDFSLNNPFAKYVKQGMQINTPKKLA